MTPVEPSTLQRRSLLGYLKVALDPPVDVTNRDVRLGGLALCGVAAPMLMAAYALEFILIIETDATEVSPRLSMALSSGAVLIGWATLVTGLYRLLWPAKSSFLTRVPKALVAAAVSLPATIMLVLPVGVAFAVVDHIKGPGVTLYDKNADAKADIDRALARSRVEHKRVLVDFGADWCRDCVVLTHLFDSPEVKPFLDEHFIVVRVDVEKWDANLDLSARYGNPIKKGIPAVVVLASDGTMFKSTGGGELADARHSTPQEVLALLQSWTGGDHGNGHP